MGCDSWSVGTGRSLSENPFILASEKTDALRKWLFRSLLIPMCPSWSPHTAVVTSEVPLAGVHEVGARFSQHQVLVKKIHCRVAPEAILEVVL